MPISKIRYLGQEIPITKFIEKGKRLDAFAENEKELFNIEASRKFTKYISWRNYAYVCQVYINSVKHGQGYRNYKHTYLINIIDNVIGKLPIRIERHVDQINEK